MEPAKNPLARLLGAARVSSDGAFEAMLVAAKHEPAVQAPEAFRAVLRAVGPFRFGLSCGYVHKDRGIQAFWYLSDYGARGTPDEMTGRIIASLDGAGFSRCNDDPSNGIEMERHRGPARESCKIQRVARFTGSKEARSGGHLVYEVELEGADPPLTVEDAVAAWPALACDDLPPAFEEYLYPLPASEVSKGGTWTQYYDWNAVVAPEGRDTSLVFIDLQAIAEENGYLLDHEDRGTMTYFRGKSDPPVVYLSKEAGGGVRFRIQPRM
ncbi:MAG: hypothetical protein JW839_16615 [Candidatus Lokiarchaeota archaeon]|nr:hypothetical protein [Candidatus Lokiarchaeota archaeon]